MHAGCRRQRWGAGCSDHRVPAPCLARKHTLSTEEEATPWGPLGLSSPGRDWVQGDFHHVGFAAGQWGWLKAEDVEYVGAG